MPALPQPNERHYTPIDAGTHLAICYRVVDLGTQEIVYQGETKRVRQVMISWEFPDELMDDGRPFTISRNYTWTMGEKSKLRQHLQSWRGKVFESQDFRPPSDGGFDISKIIGKPCLIGVVHSVKGEQRYANIDTVSKLPKAMAAPASPTNETAFLWLSPEEFDRAAFDRLSEKLKLKIYASPEYQAITSGKPVKVDETDRAETIIDEDIPF